MTKVIANMSVSVDGFVADPSDAVGELFDWYGNGPVEVVMPGDHRARHASLSEASAAQLRRHLETVGVIVAGRRLFDHAQGWGGAHPAGTPVVVVTHAAPTDWPHASFTFVTDGVPAAIARAAELAAGRDVVVASPDITRQCLDAGLLDELSLDVVPVLFGRGVRLFGDLLDGHVALDDPVVVQGTRVTHLTYRIRRG